MNGWQQGIELSVLRDFAGLFAVRHKALVHGAFGLTRERDIADALAAGALLYKRDAERVVAAAIVKPLASAGGFTDFAGREFSLPAGNIRCSALAAIDADAGSAVVDAMLGRAAGRPLWVEIFEEDTVARAVLDRFPALQYRATRIAAGSEVKGIYSDAATPAPALHPAEQVALAILEPEFAPADERAAMLAEAAEFARWEQHYSSYNLRRSWTAFALRGYDPDDPGFIIKPAEMARRWQAENPARMAARPAWTTACEHFPATMACIARILDGAVAERVRLMKLAPGGELARHADITNRDAGLADGRQARLHLPLKTSDAVVMHGWDKRGQHGEMRFPEGALCYLDQRGPHRVENRNPAAERIHLVLDVVADQILRDHIAASAHGPAPLA